MNLITDEFVGGQPAVIKDPRICRLVPVYRSALSEKTPVQAIITIRNPLEVIASLVKRNDMTKANAALLWLRYMLDAVSGSAGMTRAFVAYDQLVSGPLDALRDVSTIVGPFPTQLDNVREDVTAVLSEKLRNHEFSADQVIHDDLAHGWISDAYAALRLLVHDPSAPPPLETLRRVQSEFDAASSMLGKIIGDYDSALKELRRKSAALSASVDLKTEQVRMLRDKADDRANLDQQELNQARAALISAEAEQRILKSIRKSTFFKLFGRKKWRAPKSAQ
ncbi:MAG: hypothetical protein AAGC81_01075 [Pseudomonadota bacterium]